MMAQSKSDICPGCKRQILDGETIIIPKPPEDASVMWHSLCYLQAKKNYTTWGLCPKCKTPLKLAWMIGPMQATYCPNCDKPTNANQQITKEKP